MTVAGGQLLDPHAANLRREERRAAGVACGAHALHDGYTDLIYVMLPVWQKEFGLGYAELGLLRGLFSGTMAGFQIPSGLIAERLGAAAVLALGTALAGAGYCIAGASAGFGLLMVALFIAGLGSSTQHPLASSLMAHAYAGPRSMKALGTYNFAGDIGKMTVPAAAALLLVVMSWRPALALLGALGLVAAAAIFMLTPRYAAERPPEEVLPSTARADEPGSGRVSSARSQHQPANTGVSALMSSDALCARTLQRSCRAGRSLRSPARRAIQRSDNAITWMRGISKLP
jgi:FSR family fosmidomycin resistance protein-like MFS transporter